MHDIEDLQGFGHVEHVCPYYAARQLAKNANLVVAPYQYVIDPLIRKRMDISVDDNIFIFDEAHNMEDQCRYVSSCCGGRHKPWSREGSAEYNAG